MEHYLVFQNRSALTEFVLQFLLATLKQKQHLKSGSPDQEHTFHQQASKSAFLIIILIDFQYHSNCIEQSSTVQGNLKALAITTHMTGTTGISVMVPHLKNKTQFD